MYLSKQVFSSCITGKTLWRITLDDRRAHHWWRISTRSSFVYFLISDEQSRPVERRDASLSNEQARIYLHSPIFFPRALAIEVSIPVSMHHWRRILIKTMFDTIRYTMNRLLRWSVSCWTHDSWFVPNCIFKYMYVSPLRRSISCCSGDPRAYDLRTNSTLDDLSCIGFDVEASRAFFSRCSCGPSDWDNQNHKAVEDCLGIHCVGMDEKLIRWWRMK